jgi:tetratricopeptide (TPR) repeat protein
MIRVSAELIDAADGSTQWSDRYDRPYKDLFALQDEITRAVAGALKARLLSGVNTTVQSDRPPSGSLEAYKALLQGKFYNARQTESDWRKSIEQFEVATQLDAGYALAWSWLSREWTNLGWLFLNGAAKEDAYANARAAAEKALDLQPDLAAAQLARGNILQLADFDWHGAQAEYRRALELAPQDSEAKFSLGNSLATLGQIDQAIDLTRQALNTDPLNASESFWLAWYLCGVNRLDEAEWAAHKAIELQPGGTGFQLTLATIAILRGDARAALAAAQKEPQGYLRDAALAQALQIGNDRAAGDAALKTLIEKDADSAAYWVADVYLIRKDPDKAFEWLERAWRNRDPQIPYMLFDALLLPYKDDPRFAAFCRKVGLPTPADVAPHKA